MELLLLLLFVQVLLTVALLLFGFRKKGSEPEEGELPPAAEFKGPYVVKPYLQLGDKPQLSQRESLDIMWQLSPQDAAKHNWWVQVMVEGEDDWRDAQKARSKPFNLPQPLLSAEPIDAGDGTVIIIDPMAPLEKPVLPPNSDKKVRVKLHVEPAPPSVAMQVTIEDLPPGAKFEYRVLADAQVVFIASGQARQSVDQPYSFAVAADLGVPMRQKEQKIANQIGRANPNFLVIPGDIVYQRGRAAEYLSYFFPVYNSNDMSPDSGAPLLRSILSFAVPGNHDQAMMGTQDQPNLNEYPDSLAYYMYWNQPLNGPSVAEYGNNVPQLQGDARLLQEFKQLTGARFPRMAMFSFDWGNSHWLMLDGNAYMDWTDERIRSWVERDLASSSHARWRFVCFHQPPFNSDGKHVDEQRMRMLAPLFERYGVDVVFSGHSHVYERSRPLKFIPSEMVTVLRTEDCPVPGKFVIDTEFDGKTRRKPNGVVYIISGAAGAKMYPEGQPQQLQPYTLLHEQSVHSFTLCRVSGNALTLVQIGEDGQEVDHCIIEK